MALFERASGTLEVCFRLENGSPRKFKPRIAEKRWNPKREAEIYKTWDEEEIYRFISNSEKEIYSIDTPPPYASGRWHVGGAVHYTQIDMVSRYRRMKGAEVLFSFGVDRNGLPVEVEVERKNNIAANEVPRERFIQLCKEFLDRVEKEILTVAKRLGISSNFRNIYRTDSPEYRRVTQATFIELWKRGLVYVDNRPTNWCPVCLTTIADAELDYKELETNLCYINFSLKGGGNITIATTRPELICTCSIIIYHPEDSRYKDLDGKTAITPIFNREVPIHTHSYAKPEFGTGIAMVCSFGDYTDVRLYRELKLEPKIAITKEGRMNELAEPYKGLTVEAARRKIISDLDSAGLLVKKEKILHNTPVCWRSKNPVEFIFMEEYYLKQLSSLDNLREVVSKIEFHPPEARQILLNWINSINVDWPISRRRYYGTELPLWYCAQCGKPYLPPPDRYYQPWREKPPQAHCKCGSEEFIGETRTFDTWMDSSISQLYILGYGNDEKLFKRAFPCTLRPQGTDIIRTWLYYSLLRTYQLTGNQAFKHVRISGMGLDEAGEAMHKSKGNIVWPEPILDQYGADAFRLWGVAESKLGSNYRFSRERLEGSFRFITKLWNVARFISSFPEEEGETEFAPLDRMILAELNNLVEQCAEGYEKMDFFIPAQSIRSFVWSLFADHYLEAVKARAYNFGGEFSEALQRGGWKTLHTVLRASLKLLAPICPFITEAIWCSIYGGESIHLESFPQTQPVWESELRKITSTLIEFNSAVWRYKKGKGIALNDKLRLVYAPKALGPLNSDLKAMHRIEGLHFEEPDDATKVKLEEFDGVYFLA